LSSVICLRYAKNPIIYVGVISYFKINKKGIVVLPKKPLQESKPEPRYLKPQAVTLNHKAYHGMLKDETKKIVVVDGVAGSGKSIAAVYYACELLRKDKVKSIIFIRPNEGIGNDLGYLPGDLWDKLSPKLKQLIIYAECFTGVDRSFLISSGKIIIQSLYDLQGMDLTGSALVVDEAQNISPRAMYCICTRGAEKTIINGDSCPAQVTSKQIKSGNDGISFLIETIGDLSSVGVVKFTADDIVRQGFIKDVILRMTPALK
jgi:predicted ribonuclease YlaK